MVQVLCIDASQRGLRTVVCERSGLELSVLATAESPGTEHSWSFETYRKYHEAPEAERASLTAPSLTGELILALRNLKTTWEESVLILPVEDSLSLHLALPFDNPRSIDRVSRLAAQEQVAFSLDSFHVQARSTGVLESGRNDIRVNLIAKDYLRWILEECSRAQIDPGIVVDPSSLLSGLGAIEGVSLKSHQAILFRFPDSILLSFLIDGQVRTRHVIPIVHPNGTDSIEASSLRTIFSRIKLALRGFESRYGRACEDILVIQNSSFAKELEREFPNGMIRSFDADSLVHACPGSHSLACLGALLVSNDSKSSLSSNLRSGPFRPGFPIERISQAAKKLTFPFLLAIGVTLAGLFFWMEIREYRISRLERGLQEQVATVVPDADLSSERAITVVQKEMGKIRKQLDEVGSASRLSPVKSLLNLIEQLKHYPDFSLERVNIVGKRVSISGQAKSYAQIDRMKNGFAKQKDLYCGAPKDEARPRGSFVSVELNLFLCEE